MLIIRISFLSKDIFTKMVMELSKILADVISVKYYIDHTCKGEWILLRMVLYLNLNNIIVYFNFVFKK